MNTNLLSETETDALLVRVRAGDRVAEAALVESNLGLVYSIVNGMRIRFDNRDDMESEGSIGLLKATHSFDPDRGIPFDKWAGKEIRWAIYAASLACRHKTPCRHSTLVDSLDSPIGEDGRTRATFLADTHDNFKTIDDQIIASYYLAADLTARQRQIITMRYGLAGDPPMTLRAVAAALGVKFQAIDACERAAIAKMRRLDG